MRKTTFAIIAFGENYHIMTERAAYASERQGKGEVLEGNFETYQVAFEALNSLSLKEEAK